MSKVGPGQTPWSSRARTSAASTTRDLLSIVTVSKQHAVGGVVRCLTPPFPFVSVPNVRWDSRRMRGQQGKVVGDLHSAWIGPKQSVRSGLDLGFGCIVH